MAFMLFSLIVFILSLPLWLFLRRLPPKPIITAIRKIFWEIMKWIFPIGMTAGIVLYFVWLIFRPIILGITLGIVDISDFTPFSDLIFTGMFDWIEALLTLNPIAMYHASWKVLVNTPKFARELFGGEIRQAETASQRIEASAQQEVADQRTKQQAYEMCVSSRTIAITDNMSATEKVRARAENESNRQQCQSDILEK